MSTTQNVAAAIQEHLENVKTEVAKIKDSSGNPIQIPNYDQLYKGAGHLDDPHSDPTLKMNYIHSLLGRASNVGSETIPFNGTKPNYDVNFPQDHRMHGSMGSEWYWLGCHLNVIDEHGNTGKISLLDSMQKFRSMGTAVQAKYNWTEEQACITGNLATITTKMDGQDPAYYRRNANRQWPLKGGTSFFSSVGEPFSFVVGSDSLTGSDDVLPLRLVINDGDNMQVDLTFMNKETVNLKTSFFKQGEPIPLGNGGTGITPLPTPGIYYSWPQLNVSGTITVGGHTYTVSSGIGWIDHQMMMPSTLDAKGNPDPTLFEVTDKNHPYNGWIWQYYNLENGTSFTGAGFILGEMPVDGKVEMVYGYFLQPNAQKEWQATFIMGEQTMEDPQSFPSQCGQPNSTPVTIPTKRSYSKLTDDFNLGLLLHPISGQANPWYKDGTFNNPDQSLGAEFPADFVSATPEHHPNGVGYLESIGFEKVDDYEAYVLAMLHGVDIPAGS